MHPFKDSGRQETIVSATVSVIFGIVSLLFIARHIPGVPEWISGLPRDFFLIALPSSLVALIAGVSYFTPVHRFGSWVSKTLFLVLPAVVAFSIGWYFQSEIPETAKIIVTFYALVVLAVFFVRLVRKERPSFHAPKTPEPTPAEWIRMQGRYRTVFVLALAGIFLGFAAHDLGKSANVDEALWLYGRIPKYWNALDSLEFRKTSISDKPGITIAVVSGAGLLREDNPLAWKSLRGDDRSIDGFFFTFRIPIVLFAALFLPVFYFLLERLAGRTRALFAYTLIALAPATLGMTKIINPDAFLWLFAPLSLFSYLAYMKRRHIGYLLFSGFLLGLALLTKYVANILFVFVLGIIFLEYVFQTDRERFLPYLRRSLLGYVLWTFVALSIFLAAFPATWLKPEKILEATIFSQAFESTAFLFLSLFSVILLDRLLNRSRFAETIMDFLRSLSERIATGIGAAWLGFLSFVSWNALSGMPVYDFPGLLAAPKTILENTGVFGVFSANAFPLLFASTPPVALSLFVAGALLFRKPFIKTTAGKSILYGIVFIVLYYLGSAINGVGSITRYQIVVFPVAAMVAGFSLGSLLRIAEMKTLERFGKYSSRYAFPIVLGIIAIASVACLARTPFPLSYSSPLLPERYYTDVKDMGPGSYEAAEYLNSLPNAMNLVVWSDKDGVCKFFVGRCKSGFSWDAYENLRFDYVVVSSGRESRTSKRVGTAVEDLRKDVIRFDAYYDRTEGAAWELLINGRPTHYVRIFPFIP